ncbi:hypothetical protein BWR59_23075 [Pseudomonas sp. Bc-h]|jgi:hypothetical protein|uniref:hypothetical protein n=1 Tax=unclassified Pseudomonas TaxID=196821 RepID=UPI0009DA0D06|nr:MULTISPECIES: hypothetical protein [unclassified Pseudomonas]MDE1196424.1 hypothetical protein [Pseudomonas sp.]OQR29163.1 hypothetical protein BWR59_23075 [Pseudomonas sp. Bc-h]
MGSNALLDLGITVVTALSLIDALLLVWVAKFKLEPLEASLIDCKLISDSKRHWGASGALSRQMRLSMVFSAIFFCGMWERNGLVRGDQVRRVPGRLKYWVYIPYLAGAVLLTMTLILLLASGDITI